jgi:putative inorganic carbon (HCO3(-)) transporter
MKPFAKLILLVEPLLLVIVVSAFWFDNPLRVYFLPILIAPLIARVILYRRLYVNTPLTGFFGLFILICVINTYVALADPLAPPHSWGWYQIGRPIMGATLALSIASIVYERGRIDGALTAVLAMALLIGILGLGGAQYVSKSGQLEALIQFIPKITGFPGAADGFNVNEIGGAMAFFAPLAFGIALDEWVNWRSRPRRILATGAFIVLALALFFGQSRLALIGVSLTMIVQIILIIRSWRWRSIALALLLLFGIVEVTLVTQVFQPANVGEENLSRDETSFSQRPIIWGAALDMIREYPLTGYGLNQFRRREVRDTYVPDFVMTVIPHAHNELLQVGADTGIPGMIVYVGWHIGLAVMAWRTWRRGDPFLRAVVAAAAGGLVAHAIFGLGDAITLFDRFTFAYWLLVGLVCGVYVLTGKKSAPSRESRRERLHCEGKIIPLILQKVNKLL